MENYDLLFGTAKVEQLKQMSANEHKTGWENIEGDIVSQGIMHNMEEMKEAECSDDVIRRMANIANYACMAILAMKEEPK